MECNARDFRIVAEHEQKLSRKDEHSLPLSKNKPEASVKRRQRMPVTSVITSLVYTERLMHDDSKNTSVICSRL
eukprot:4956750-Amphidinium_carterae.1